MKGFTQPCGEPNGLEPMLWPEALLRRLNDTAAEETLLPMNEINKLLTEIHSRMDQYPAIPVCMFLFVLALIFWHRKTKKAVATGIPYTAQNTRNGLLSQVLYWWSPRDPLTIRDLLRSIAIFGASGSGKTSGSGYQLAKAIVGAGKKIGGIIFSSKPEDRDFWERIFKKAGRLRDLLVFSPDEPLRFDGLDSIQKSGGDTRDCTDSLMAMRDTVRQNRSGGGREGEDFWREQEERTDYNGIEILRLARGRVTAPDLQRFINGAALTPAALNTPEWRAGFHNRCLETAYSNIRTSIQRHDYEVAAEFWLKEWPSMADKTRSSILAGVMGTLHVFNTGVVRELMSTSTNVSPEVMDEGKWVLINMPISTYGASGAAVIGMWKYLAQRHILKRHATENTPACVIWADEAQRVVNSFDSAYLAECRSHRGCMVYLTQSIHAYYARLRGDGGEHETDALLTNFGGAKIFHAVGDDKTAAYASSLIGRRLTTHIGGSTAPTDNAYDELFGRSRFSASFSQHVENVLENREFMQGLRTGGEANGCMVDGIVVRSGEPFSNGEPWLKVAFSQK